MKFSRIVLLLFLAVNIAAFAQTAQKSGDKDKDNDFKIRLKWKSPLNVAFSYKMIEKTIVQRVFSDSSKVNYERNSTVYFTIRGSDLPKEGFQNVSVSIDSLNYNFKDAEHDISYISQDDNSVPPTKFEDFLPYFALLGMEYDLVYSPYGDVVKVEGKKYEERLATIDDPATKVKDPVIYSIWKHTPDLQNLVFYTDVSKSFLPSFGFNKDTSWTQNLMLKVDGVFLKDSAKFHLDTYTPNILVLFGESQQLKESSEKVLPPLIPKDLDVKDAKGKINYRVEIDPRGIMDFTGINFDGDIDLLVGNDVVKQHTKTDYSWKLIKTYRW